MEKAFILNGDFNHFRKIGEEVEKYSILLSKVLTSTQHSSRSRTVIFTINLGKTNSDNVTRLLSKYCDIVENPSSAEGKEELRRIGYGAYVQFIDETSYDDRANIKILFDSDLSQSGMIFIGNRLSGKSEDVEVTTLHVPSLQRYNTDKGLLQTMYVINNALYLDKEGEGRVVGFSSWKKDTKNYSEQELEIHLDTVLNAINSDDPNLLDLIEKHFPNGFAEAVDVTPEVIEKLSREIDKIKTRNFSSIYESNTRKGLVYLDPKKDKKIIDRYMDSTPDFLVDLLALNDEYYLKGDMMPFGKWRSKLEDAWGVEFSARNADELRSQITKYLDTEGGETLESVMTALNEGIPLSRLRIQ